MRTLGIAPSQVKHYVHQPTVRYSTLTVSLRVTPGYLPSANATPHHYEAWLVSPPKPHFLLGFCDAVDFPFFADSRE